ncbi:acyltransferase domain-containing protein [Streptacidiphilus sp. 4-A2]|nr:acyltransferase domain-containing protein [Streptacidiphilus sp. 4-A2]
MSVAAVNGPGATVVSGTPEVLAEIEAACVRDGVRVRVLPVDYASHGPQVDAIREEVLRLLEGVAPRSARVPMVSAMTGEYLSGPELDAGYWYASLRATVEFSRAVEVLGRDGYGVFVEASAHPVLTAAVSETLEVWCPVRWWVGRCVGMMVVRGGCWLRLLRCMCRVWGWIGRWCCRWVCGWGCRRMRFSGSGTGPSRLRLCVGWLSVGRRRRVRSGLR